MISPIRFVPSKIRSGGFHVYQVKKTCSAALQFRTVGLRSFSHLALLPVLIKQGRYSMKEVQLYKNSRREKNAMSVVFILLFYNKNPTRCKKQQQQ
eukprot:scaffold40361_cov221-Amphora_coffeaeformis.AAC.4